MNRLSRRSFLHLSAGTAAGLYLAACQPIQAPTPMYTPTPEPRILAPLPVPEAVDVNLLTPEQMDEVQYLVDFSMEYNIVPGIGVGIARDGEIVFAKGFGVTQVGTEQPVTTRSLFRVMDMTHIFTATAAMQLVEQGKLDLDTPVVEYLPYFQLADERYTQITVCQLLTETAGLPATDVFQPAKDWEGITRQTDDGALERYVRSLGDVRLGADPGASHVFCNMAYDILGDVIAKVSGEVFEDYMAQHILRPLGMVNSTFYPEEAPPELLVTPHVTSGWMGEAVVSELVTHSRERAPSVGLFTNVADMNRWMLANLNGGELDGVRILQEATYDQHSDRALTLPWSVFDAKGLGWYLWAFRNHPGYAYMGADVGFNVACYLVPEAGFGVTALCNQYVSESDSGVYVETIATSILEMLAA